MPEPRILVVDDNPSMRKLLGMLLRQMGGLRTDFAGNGIEAAALLDLIRYDIIIIDNAMPEITGLEFLRTHRDLLNGCGSSVIMVTAVPNEEIVRAARNGEIQLHDLVVKPFDIKVMSERIRKALERRKGSGSPGRPAFDGGGVSTPAASLTNLSGRMLSIAVSVAKTTATVSMNGLLMNEDRTVVTSFIQSLPKIPGDSLVMDLSGVIGIDEFGLGSLLFINGMAAAAGKKAYLMAESCSVWGRIRAVGIPEIVSTCGEKHEPVPTPVMLDNR